MARRPIPSLEADFANVMSFLKKGRIIPSPLGEPQVLSAKRIHRATHSLMLWRFRLRRLPEHGRVFIEEIASDAVQVLPQALMGYRKATKLLIRGVIENTLRHIYFTDHPIEFVRMNREAKWYLSTEALFDYAKYHPIFMRTEPKFDALARLSTLYTDLSAAVHGRAVKDFEMRKALKKIVWRDEDLKDLATLSERCAEAANFLLASFHYAQAVAFQPEDRQIILRTMESRAREVWQNLAL